MDNEMDKKGAEKFYKEVMKSIINNNPQFSKEAKDNMNHIIEMAKKPEDALEGCLSYAYLYNGNLG